MFQFIAKYRRRRSTRNRCAPRDRKLSHYLGVEAMEDRMMLAATGLEYEPSDTPMIQIAVMDPVAQTDYGIDFRGEWSKLLAQRPEGGFVANSLSFADAVSNLTISAAGVTSDQVSWTGLVRNNFPSPNQAMDQDSTIRDSLDFDGFDVYQGGLDPANILETPSYSDYTDGDATETNVVRNDNAPGSATEGGPISIPVILASRELGGGSPLDPAHGTKSLASLSSSAVGPSRVAADSLALNAISAEWARAMVLETAGGEPDGIRQLGADQHNGRSSELDASSSQGVGEPLSSDQPGRAAEKIATPATDTPPAGHAAAQNTPDGPLRLVGATLAGFASAVSSGDATLDLTQLAGGAGQGAAETNATDATFDEIGGGDQSLLQSLADSGWRRPLAAAPLVMILALERIAAGNSRRGNRDAAPGIVRRRKLRRDGQDA